MVLQVQGQVAHHGLPPLLLLHAGRLHGALLPLLRPEEVPGVREGGGAGLHAGPGELEGGEGGQSRVNDNRQATVRGPGLVFILPFLEKAQIIDIRTKVFEVPTQQILTTDSVRSTDNGHDNPLGLQVTLTVDAVVYYRVFDPVLAATGAMDYNEVTVSKIILSS